MHVIAKRNILFIHEGDFRAQIAGGSTKAPRKFEVKFGRDIQEIPDWVGEQDAFKVAASDGTIIEVGVKTAVKQTIDITPVPGPDLSKMSKAELQDHALEAHDLALDDELTKNEMIAAIKEAAAK